MHSTIWFPYFMYKDMSCSLQKGKIAYLMQQEVAWYHTTEHCLLGWLWCCLPSEEQSKIFPSSLEHRNNHPNPGNIQFSQTTAEILGDQMFPHWLPPVKSSQNQPIQKMLMRVQTSYGVYSLSFPKFFFPFFSPVFLISM